MPFRNAATSAGEIAGFTGLGLSPPLARRSAPTPRAPPEAATCCSFLPAVADFVRLLKPNPFFFSSAFLSSGLAGGFAPPVSPAEPSTTVATLVSGVGWYLMDEV